MNSDSTEAMSEGMLWPFASGILEISEAKAPWVSWVEAAARTADS